MNFVSILIIVKGLKMDLEQEIFDDVLAETKVYIPKDCDLSNEKNAEEFTYGFYDALKAMESMMPLEIPDISHLITITDECDELEKAPSHCKEVSFILPYTLDTKVIREFEMGKRDYLLKHPDKKKPVRYNFREINDVFKIPGFDIDEFATAFYDTSLGKKIKDVNSFDNRVISKRRSSDLDFDSFCLILRDKTITLEDNKSYLILETQCFDENSGKVYECYSTIIVGELIYFKRTKEGFVEKVVAQAKGVEKEEHSILREIAKEYGFKGCVCAWYIPCQEIIPVEYSKLVLK